MNKLEQIRELGSNKQGIAILKYSAATRKTILSKLKRNEILSMLHYLDPDDATDLLQHLTEKRRKNIVEKLDVALKEKVEYLLKFNPNTAAGMMSLDYVQIKKGMSFSEVFKIFKKHEVRTGKAPAMLVTDDGLLIGEVPMRLLVLRNPLEKVDKYVRRMPTIRFDRDNDAVIGKFKSHPHNRIAVIDEDNSIMGVIYSDDVLRAIKKPSGDLYDFAGVREEEDINDSILTKVRHRYKWLILNLITGFMAASVVAIFKDTISAAVLLAVYMPIVAGMGGNAGTQTLAVIIRSLALKEIDLKTCKKAIIKEIFAGALNGIIIGGLVASVALFYNKNAMLGLAIGLAMIANLMIAGFFGAITPLVMKSLNKDPATSAIIFITTATDICGFFTFLGLASILM